MTTRGPHAKAQRVALTIGAPMRGFTDAPGANSMTLGGSS